MPSRLRIAAVTSAMALAATSLTLPLAEPARAAAPVEKAFVVVDPGTGAYELHVRTTPNGPLGPSLTTSNVDVDEVAASADGSRVATIESVYDAHDNPVSQRVVVRDVGTRVARTLDTYAYDGNAADGFSAIALSPDGSRATWTTSPTYQRSTVLVGAGTPTRILGGSEGFTSFVDDTTVLGYTYGVGWHTTPVLGGDDVAASGIPSAVYGFAVSPDHTHVAWTQETSPGAGTYRLYVADLAVVPGAAGAAATATVTNAQWVAQSFPDAPTFSHDSATIYFVDGDTTGALKKVPTDGSAGATAVDATSIGDVLALAIGATDDGVAPGAVTAKPAQVTATTATVHWALPTDADLSGVVVTRSGGGLATKATYVPAPQTAWTDTGLTKGATLTYSFKAIDRSNNLGAASSRIVVPTDALPVTFADPTSTGSRTTSFVVTMPAAAPVGTTFRVDVITSGSSTWQQWVTASTARTQVFGSAARTGVLATTSTAGTSYSFRVSYGVSHGNSTAWKGSVRAVVPFDQAKATLYGGTTLATSYAYLGSHRRISHTTDYVRITFVGNKFQLIGTKCSSCGQFAIYDGGSYMGSYDTRAASTTPRAVLFTIYVTGEHTFTIRPRATAGRPYVFVDGFAIRS